MAEEVTTPPAPPVAPGVAGPGEDPVQDAPSAKEKREAKKAEEALVARATFKEEDPTSEADSKGDPLFDTVPASESPWNTEDGFIGVDPTHQGPSDVRSVGPDTE